MLRVLHQFRCGKCGGNLELRYRDTWTGFRTLVCATCERAKTAAAFGGEVEA